MYLALPATWLEVQQEEKQTGRSFHHSGAVAVTKDSFQIASLTCSTKLTQNGEVRVHVDPVLFLFGVAPLDRHFDHAHQRDSLAGGAAPSHPSSAPPVVTWVRAAALR